MMRASAARVHGFTLLELLVTLAVALILWAWAYEPLTALRVRSQLRNLEQDLEAAFSYARMRAVQQRTDVVICAMSRISAASVNVASQCRRDNQWADGWLVFNDNNKNWQLDTNETLWLKQVPLFSDAASPRTPDFSVTSNAFITPYAIRFTAFGLTSTKATFTLAAPSGEKRYLCMGAGARVRSGDAAGC